MDGFAHSDENSCSYTQVLCVKLCYKEVNVCACCSNNFIDGQYGYVNTQTVLSILNTQVTLTLTILHFILWFINMFCFGFMD